MTKDEKCPYCGYEHCEALFVDIGVGEQQASPYGCPNCGAVEIGADAYIEGVKLSEIERETGWYDPEREV